MAGFGTVAVQQLCIKQLQLRLSPYVKTDLFPGATGQVPGPGFSPVMPGYQADDIESKAQRTRLPSSKPAYSIYSCV